MGWQSMPKHVRDTVFSFLPLEAIARCRSVCKEWNSVLTCPKFLTYWNQTHNKHPWLLLCDGTAAYSLQFSSWTWEKAFPISFEPYFSKPSSSVVYSCLDAAIGEGAGLLLLLPKCYFCSAFSVWNPITGKRFSLPPLLAIDPSQATVRAVVGGDDKFSYKVIVVGDTGGKYSRYAGFNNYKTFVEIYDSRRQSWRITGNLPTYIMAMKVVYCGGFLFILTIYTDLGPGVAVCRIEDCEVVEYVPLPLAWKRGNISPSLVVCGSRVLVAAQVAKEFVVHELKFEAEPSVSSQWNAITKSPPEICQQISKDWNWIDCHCRGVGDYICFIYFGKSAVAMAVYNMKQSQWTWMPACFSMPNKLMCSILFEPRPDMEL